MYVCVCLQAILNDLKFLKTKWSGDNDSLCKFVRSGKGILVELIAFVIHT